MLRVLAMLAVVFLHIQGHGGIMAEVSRSPLKNAVVMVFEVAAFPAVNCFVLISGYVGYRKEHFFPRLKNVISLFFTVLFYSVVIFGVFAWIDPSVRKPYELIKAFFPVTLKQYWFFTAYLGMFLLSPVLNSLVYFSNRKTDFVFAAALFFFCVISLVGEAFDLLAGYSMIWFVFLYLLGAMVKKYDLNRRISNRTCVAAIAGSFLITWLPKVVLPFLNVPFIPQFSSILLSYTSPTVVLMALGWLCLLGKAECRPIVPVIRFLTPSMFSVYLIHDHPLTRQYLISHIHKLVTGYSAWALAAAIPLIAVGIFLACVLVDKGRDKLFSLLRLHRLADHLQIFVTRKLSTVYRWISSD